MNNARDVMSQVVQAEKKTNRIIESARAEAEKIRAGIPHEVAKVKADLLNKAEKEMEKKRKETLKRLQKSSESEVEKELKKFRAEMEKFRIRVPEVVEELVNEVKEWLMS